MTAWWHSLADADRWALARLLLDGSPVDLGAALHGALEGDPLPRAAMRAVALSGGRPHHRRDLWTALRAAAPRFLVGHRELLRRLMLEAVDLALEPKPVELVADAAALNARVLGAGGYVVAALVDGHLVYLPRREGAPPPISVLGAMSERVRIDAHVGRWWPCAPDSTDGAVRVEVAPSAPAELAARLEIASSRAAASHPQADRVVVVVGQHALVDVCPQRLARAARWAARAMAQDIGESAGRGLDVHPAAWGAAEAAEIEQRWLADGPADDELHVGVERHRRRLEQIPTRGPDPAPALMAPPGFADRWSAAEDLVADKAKRVRRRRSPAGRPKALSLARYVRARRAVEGRGEVASDSAVMRELAREGVRVARTTVLTRRMELEHLDAGALAGIDDGQRREGLDAIAATAVTTRGQASSGLWPYAGGKGRLVGELTQELPPGRIALAEVCAGGAAFFLHLAAAGRIERAILVEADAVIANLWLWLQRDARGVFEMARRWPWSAEAFERARDAMGELHGIEQAGAALFVLWLARNGLWRRRKDGGLNMPPGDRPGLGVTSRPKPEDLADAIALGAENLRSRLCQAQEWLAGVSIVCGDAEDVIDRLPPWWVVYCDPPYWPVSKTASFCGYAGTPFGAGSQARLVRALRGHEARGGMALYSNAASDPVLRLVHGARRRWVYPYRSVSVVSETRGGAPELVVTLGAGGMGCRDMAGPNGGRRRHAT